MMIFPHVSKLASIAIEGHELDAVEGDIKIDLIGAEWSEVACC